MSDRDWDAEMRKIDQQLASIPNEATQPARAHPTGGGAAIAGAGRPETSTFGVMARLGLACVLGVAIVFWPYTARCGVGLAGYLAAVTTLVVAGVWSSIWTWKHRSAKGHTVSLLLVTWGLVLAAADVLPRVGYAKPSANHPANWTCS
jgi:putative flippase GtrA